MPIPEGYADCSVEIHLTGYVRPAFVTFGVQNVANFSPDGIAAWIRGVWTNASQSPNRWADASTTATVFTVRLGTDTGEPLVGTAVNSNPGGGAFNSPPPNVSVLVHKRTLRGGRRGRGRMFMPWWVDESVVDESGQIASSWLANQQLGMTYLLTNLDTGGTPMALLHGDGITPTGPPNLVTSLTVDPIIATQRRRLLR